MLRTDRHAAWVILAATLAVGACESLEPNSVTEARNQLARGGERTTSLTVPLIVDTFAVTDVLDSNSTTTTPGGLVGVTFDADSVAVDVGNQLQFSNVQMDAVNYDYPPGLPGAGPPVNFSLSQNVLQGEARLQAVDTITAQSGSLSVTVANKLPHSVSFTVTLKGFLTAGGAQLSQSGTVNARVQNDGSSNSVTVNFNLANVRILPDSDAVLSGTITLSGTAADPSTLNDAIALTGTGNMVVQSLAGSLDPAITPELSVTTENADEFTRAQIDLGDFEDAIRLSHLNSATINATVVNSAQVPLRFTNFRVGAVRLDAAGQPVRVSGQLDFEKDGAGNPIFINIVDPGQTTLSIARGQPGTPTTKTVTFGGALLLDTLIHKLLNNTRMALVTTGGTTIGDGNPSRISRTDVIKVRFGLSIGLDLTLPLAGVTFKRKQVVGGADLNNADADEVTKRLLQATLSAAVANGTPFGVGLQISLIRDSSALTVDGLLALPICAATQVPTSTCRVSLVSVNVAGGTVDASGLVTAPASGNVELSLSGNTARALLGRRVTLAFLIQLVPGPGGSGRGALRPSDRLVVNAKAKLDLTSGGS